MSQSTPLDNLDGPSPASSSDANLVSKILADINSTGSPPNQPNNVALSQQGSPRMILSEPPIQSTMSHTMDPEPARAHMIGSSTPTVEDFTAMMNSYVSVPQQNPVQPMAMPGPQKQDMWSYLAERIRAPIVVAALFFLLNMPIFRTSVMSFAPWAFRAGAELSMIGLLALSLIAGFLFAGYQLLSDIIGV